MSFDHVDRGMGHAPERPRHFEGDVKIQEFPGPFPCGVEVLAVHFGPGGRTRPHVHGAGQVLYITSGRGIVATIAGLKYVEAGDIVMAGPNEWHWHGGTPSSEMTHVTVQMPGATRWDDVPERDWSTAYADA